MKTALILDSDKASSHPMEGVLNKRDFLVIRAGTTEEAVQLLKNAKAPFDLMIMEVPVRGSASQAEAAVEIHRSAPDLPILMVSDLSLENWPEEDFLRFGDLVSGRVDLLVKPLSQASFMARTNALIYTISYTESKRLFDNAKSRREAIG